MSIPFWLARIRSGSSGPAWRPPRDRDAATTLIGGPVAALRRPPANLTRTLCALTQRGGTSDTSPSGTTPVRRVHGAGQVAQRGHAPRCPVH